MRAFQKRGMLLALVIIFLLMTVLCGRLGYWMLFRSGEYGERAQDVWQRERPIKAARGQIFDRNGVVLATNRSVCTVSVIHNQITDPEFVIHELAAALNLTEEYVRKRVEKYSSMERIKSNVSKETGDYLKSLEMAGVVVDEDYKRYYPIGTLAARVLGFTGADNQGIVGLEVTYDSILQGKNGTILTTTTAHGYNIDGTAEQRVEPIAGKDLYISMDYNLQLYCQQAAQKCLATTGAKTVSIVVMNPKNGELLAMTTWPEFDANNPYEILSSMLIRKTEEGEVAVDYEELTEEEKTTILNQMWRNPIVSDTYEPGSTFKIITTTAALEKGVVAVNDHFFCPGYRIVEDRTIHCHKVTGHGAEDFRLGIMNSCNPVFMDIGERVGATDMYGSYKKLGLMSRTGIDLPGEANSIFHKLENVGGVELATMSFGQSFQITPLQLLRAVSCAINGGTLITPHFGVSVVEEGTAVTELTYGSTPGVVSTETTETLRELLEAVVAEGTGKRAYLEGYRIGGKTATSEKLPRSENKYIASFVGFAPANDPEIIALVLIDEPVGVYYGGTIAAPVISEVFENALPYLGIARQNVKEKVD